MSQTILMVVVQLLSLGLPAIGITVGSDALTSFIQTGLIIASGLWIWFRRVQAGGVSGFGVRK